MKKNVRKVLMVMIIFAFSITVNIPRNSMPDKEIYGANVEERNSMPDKEIYGANVEERNSMPDKEIYG